MAAGVTSVWGGEKIQFSGPETDKKVQSESVRKSKPIEAQKFLFLDGGMNNPAPQMMAPPPTVIFPDRKKQEENDQQRNWLLVQPEDRNKSLTLEQVYKIKDHGIDGRETEADSVVSRFLQSRRGPVSTGPSDRSNRQAKEEEESGRATASKSPFEMTGSDERRELNSPLRREFDTPARPSRFEEMSLDRHRERMNEYKQLFEPPGRRGGYDPINSMVDATRQEANPVTPVRSDSFNRIPSADPFNQNNAALSPRAPTIETPYERAFGRQPTTDSLPQADSTKPKYKPAILPFPKRVM